MSEFRVHERLAQDSVWVADLPLSQIRVMNNRDFPWILLVPKVPEISEFFELPDKVQISLIQEISVISRLLKEITQCHKINVAWLGNQVPQLHIHIIARKITDHAWPNPVWGQGAHPYEPQELAGLIAGIQQRLKT